MLPRRSSSRLERQKILKEEEEQRRFAKQAQEAARLQRLDKDAEEREMWAMITSDGLYTISVPRHSY